MNNPSSEHAEKLLRVLVVTLIFSVMNGTMFNVALPAIGKEFELAPSQVSWMMTSYMVVYAVGSIVMGKLADKYRLKDLLTIGLFIFAIGSMLGMLSASYGLVIAGRIIQAAGASVLPATAMIIPIRYFAPERRGRALGTAAVGLALGNALGPVAAGLLTSVGSWRLLFAISLLPLLTLPFFRKYLDDARGQDGTIDWLGGGLLAATVSSFLLAITQSNAWLAALGAILLALFAVRIQRAADPFIQPRLFRNRSFSVGLLLAFLTTSMSFSMMFMTPQFLAALNGLASGTIGFVLVPAALAAALMGRWGGKLADRQGSFALMLLASLLIFCCFVLLSTVMGAAAYVIAVVLILGNVGQTFMQVAMSNTISRTLSRAETGVGMGMFSMINFISGAIAMSVIGKFLDAGTVSTHLNPFVLHEGAYLYSNIFIVLASLLLVAAAIYWMQFGGKLSAVSRDVQP